MAYERFRYWQDWERCPGVDDTGTARYMQSGTILKSPTGPYRDLGSSSRSGTTPSSSAGCRSMSGVHSGRRNVPATRISGKSRNGRSTAGSSLRGLGTGTTRSLRRKTCSVRRRTMAGVGRSVKVKTRALRHEVDHVPSPPDFDVETDGFHTSDGDTGIYFRPETGNHIVIGSEDPECDPPVWVERRDSLDRNVTEAQWQARLPARATDPDVAHPA